LLWSTADIPAGGWSWTVRPYASGLTEAFVDPLQGMDPIGSDTICFQYNFLVEREHAFEQVEGEIYWLEVIAMDVVGGQWGWKTADPQKQPQFMDDAAFLNESGQWVELVYPAGHPYAGESIDLAFVITPEPGTIAMLLAGAAVGLFVAVRRWRK
jgi:hypothetical protein